MTNGEKLVNTFHGKVSKTDGVVHFSTDGWIHAYDDEWWNSEYKEPTTKNNLAVDCISRESVLELLNDYRDKHFENRKEYPVNYGTLLDILRWIRNLPSVTPQEPILDKIKEDFIARYPRNYAGELELGGRSCVFSLNDILRTIDKYKAESEEINDM